VLQPNQNNEEHLGSMFFPVDDTLRNNEDSSVRQSTSSTNSKDLASRGIVDVEENGNESCSNLIRSLIDRQAGNFLIRLHELYTVILKIVIDYKITNLNL
jgi:hypothetical protein